MAEKSALIVDDSATARILLAKVLNGMDVATKHAKSGEEALSILKTSHPDLIFLDHLMPGMDGFQTLKAIKHNPETQSIPVVMYTSQNALKYREEAKALGAAGVITKQLDREQLYMLVEKIWLQHESLRTPVQQPQDEPIQVEEQIARGNVVEFRPAPPRYTAADHSRSGKADSRDSVHSMIESELQKLHADSRQDAGRYKNILIILLSAFALYALFAMNGQQSEISRLESQIDANRKVMQEMIDILEHSQ